MPTVRSGANVDEIVEAATLFRALGHPMRLGIVEALARGECCVSELQDALGVPQALVSQQLARLRAVGIVTCRRDGARMCYTVADQRVLRLLDSCRLRNRPTRRAALTHREEP